jgi:hypothetical protein
MLIVGAMVETLVKHMTQNYLDNMDGVHINGAPSWYMTPTKDKMCVFTHSKGDYSAIDVAKNNAKFTMIKKIDGVIDIVVYDNIKNIKDPKEKIIVDRFKRDDNIKIFVNKNLKYSKTVYEDEVQTAFVRSCIDNKIFLKYQNERLLDINEKVLGAKSSNSFNDLDEEFGDDKSDKKDKFDF